MKQAPSKSENPHAEWRGAVASAFWPGVASSLARAGALHACMHASAVSCQSARTRCVEWRQYLRAGRKVGRVTDDDARGQGVISCGSTLWLLP